MSVRRYGWKKDVIDHRDFKISVPCRITESVPNHWTNVAMMPPVFDQLQLGSCTGNAWSAAFEQVLHKLGLHIFRPSRLFIYYNERLVEGTVSEDAGAQIRDGIKVIAKYGVCPESMWPYDPTKFAQKPTASAYDTAIKHLGLKYRLVNQSIGDVCAVISSGFPIVFGFNVFSSFEGQEIATTGEMPMPVPNEQTIGGHAVVTAGYDKLHKNQDGTTGAVLVRNSWGTDWGQKGYFYMPFSFFLDPAYVSNIWTLTQDE